MAADTQYGVDPQNMQPMTMPPGEMDPAAGGYDVSPSELELCLIDAMDSLTKTAKALPEPEGVAKLCQGVQALGLAYSSIVTANTQAIVALRQQETPSGGQNPAQGA